jgi:hypothetical protein
MVVRISVFFLNFACNSYALGAIKKELQLDNLVNSRYFLETGCSFPRSRFQTRQHIMQYDEFQKQVQQDACIPDLSYPVAMEIAADCSCSWGRDLPITIPANSNASFTLENHLDSGRIYIDRMAATTTPSVSNCWISHR